MKAYVITSGEYSDYHIDHITLDKDKAYSYAKYLGCDYEVEEYDLDDFEVGDKDDIWQKQKEERYAIQYVFLLQGNDVIFKSACRVLSWKRKTEYIFSNEKKMLLKLIGVRVVLEEASAAKAIKIARDMVVKYRAQITF